VAEDQNLQEVSVVAALFYLLQLNSCRNSAG
jgi:hypothetical protein